MFVLCLGEWSDSAKIDCKEAYSEVSFTLHGGCSNMTTDFY